MTSSSSALIVTAFDANHFDLAQDMAASYRRAYASRYPLAAIVYGAKAAPPALAALFDKVLHMPSDDASFDNTRGFFMAYSGLKARLPEVLPGYASYCWIDADCWFQGDESIPRMLAGVQSHDICIHPEFDVHYVNYPTPSRRTLDIYQTNEDGDLAAMPLSMPMVNAGVFAMRADSRVWSLWGAELERLRERQRQGRPVFFSDQIALHKLIHQHRLRMYPLPAVDNWQTYACIPLIHRDSRSLRVPTPPYEKIGLIHLAGKTKDHTYQIDGRPLTLRYRDMRSLFGG